MSELSQFPQQRAFHCPQCKGRIVIPSDLPATTGPCPHCQATITSPDPVIHAAVIQEDLMPQDESRPAPTPTPEPVEIPTSNSANQTEEDISPVVPERSKKSKKSTKRTSPYTLILLLVILLGSLGGGSYFLIDKLKPKTNTTALPPVNRPIQPSVNPTLINYLAATSLEEKLNHVSNAEELRPKMEEFYKEGMIDETDTPASAFSFVPLPELDSKKGFILFAYDQPASTTPDSEGQPESEPSANSIAERTKILAFLKETETGVKLDWEVFAQTKYRTFNHFIKSPTLGKSEVFRVIVTKDSTSDTAGYLFSDPAHQTDSVQITPDPKSRASQELESLLLDSISSSGPARYTATIELTWAGDPKKPQLEIKRFICWEFLGLGGKEIAEINPSN